MKPFDMFGDFNKEHSDFPTLCNSIAMLNFSIGGLQRFVNEETVGISNKILVSVKAVVTAFENLKKECAPEGCTI